MTLRNLGNNNIKNKAKSISSRLDDVFKILIAYHQINWFIWQKTLFHEFVKQNQKIMVSNPFDLK